MQSHAPSSAALSDPSARPRTGALVQAIAVMLTATPILAVALWSLKWVL